jgi:serine phosphatase RsbU (regulator of sigma subunit)
VIPALEAGPPLGVVQEFDYLDVQEALLPNATMILCTDGLIERRHESLEVGLRRLAESSSLDEPTEKMADAIIQRQMSDEGYEDDAALLVVRTTRTVEGPLVIPPAAQPATSRGGA